jgi:hypothetical protein
MVPHTRHHPIPPHELHDEPTHLEIMETLALVLRKIKKIEQRFELME